MRKIEHIGIAVKSLETSNLLFEKLFGAPSYKQEEVASEGVKTSFFMVKYIVFDLKVSCFKENLHSGYSGIVPDPYHIATTLINKLIDFKSH